MNNIFNLQNLILEIKNKIKIDLEHKSSIDLEDYKNIIKQYNSVDYKDYIDFEIKSEIKKYNRIKIYEDNNFEILLICWNKNSITPLHCHPKNGCILKVLDGILYETKIIENEIYENNKLKQNDISYMHDDYGQHVIFTKNRAVSLHIYSPPNFYK